MKRVFIVAVLFLLAIVCASHTLVFAQGFRSDDPWSERQREIIQEQRDKMKVLNQQTQDKMTDITKWRDEEVERIHKDANAEMKKIQQEANTELTNIQAQIINLQKRSQKTQVDTNAKLIKLQQDAGVASEGRQKEAELKAEQAKAWHKKETAKIKKELDQRLQDEGTVGNFGPTAIAPTGPPSIKK